MNDLEIAKESFIHAVENHHQISEVGRFKIVLKVITDKITGGENYYESNVNYRVVFERTLANYSGKIIGLGLGLASMDFVIDHAGMTARSIPVFSLILRWALSEQDNCGRPIEIITKTIRNNEDHEAIIEWANNRINQVEFAKGLCYAYAVGTLIIGVSRMGI